MRNVSQAAPKTAEGLPIQGYAEQRWPETLHAHFRPHARTLRLKRTRGPSRLAISISFLPGTTATLRSKYCMACSVQASIGMMHKLQAARAVALA